MTPQDVIAGLQNDPETLLRHCYLVVASGPLKTARANGPAPIRTFEVLMQDVTVPGFTTGLSGLRGKTKNRANALITRRHGAARTVLKDNQFNAYYIPMMQVGDVGTNHSHYTLPTTGNGPTIAITSQITACVFSLGSHANGAVLASHIQPPGGPANTHDMRQGQAATAGATGFNGGVLQVRHGDQYGMGDRVAIIGRLSKARWTFYMQRTSFLGYDDGLVRSAAKIIRLG